MKLSALVAVSLAISTLAAPMARSQEADPEPMTPVVGPTQICFKYSSFRLVEGESIVGFQGGMEAMAIDVVGPHGPYRIGESEIFAAPADLGRRLSRHQGTSVYRLQDPELRYALYGKTSFSTDRERLVIWLGGRALDGSSRDAQIYDRLVVGDPLTLPCQHTYTYDWGF